MENHLHFLHYPQNHSDGSPVDKHEAHYCTETCGRYCTKREGLLYNYIGLPNIHGIKSFFSILETYQGSLANVILKKNSVMTEIFHLKCFSTTSPGGGYRHIAQ